MAGPRYELFSMLAEAAMQDMGVALIPPFLIRQELEAGRLVVPFQHSYRTAKAYHLVLPERKAEDPSLSAFSDWLVAEVTAFKETAAL